MAFMMPVMKNNYDIYKDSRSRKTSECSTTSSNGGAPTLSSAMGVPPNGRVRKVSECKSESFATSPSHTYRMQMQRCQSSRAFPRNASRTSHSSAAGALSPTRSFSQASSPPKTINTAESQNDITKFHLRLVDKLRKSFRKDSAKRSWERERILHNSNSSGSYPNEDGSTTKAENNNFKQNRETQQHSLVDSPQDSASRRQSAVRDVVCASADTATTHKESNIVAADVAEDAEDWPKFQDSNVIAVPGSLAAHLGRRITAPLTRANLKRCHKKFAKMQLTAADQHSIVGQMDAPSTIELYSSSDGSSLFGGGDRRQLLTGKKLHQKRIKNPTTTSAIAEIAEKPKQTEATGRSRKARKRLHFLRRSTSRFSSKSAPG